VDAHDVGPAWTEIAEHLRAQVRGVQWPSGEEVLVDEPVDVGVPRVSEVGRAQPGADVGGRLGDVEQGAECGLFGQPHGVIAVDHRATSWGRDREVPRIAASVSTTASSSACR
jgi:hypothetical protein